ncbi:MAG: c-type cytochrome [Chitinophagaceae bacterium]
MRNFFAVVMFICLSAIIFYACADSTSKENTSTTENYGGFESQVKWGEHLVTVSACHDCHTPKKMTAMGPDIDSAFLLAGHMAGSPVPEVNRKEMQDKGLVVTGDLTSWVGPWGISYTANLTSDSTGIGSWKEEQFFRAIREGKFKGLVTNRDLLPPMPWQMYRNMTDNEIKAIFAYLKTTKPIKNVVPQPVPPATN